jgi:S-adenosylmethionine synthetase
MKLKLHAFGTWFIHKLLQELAILRRENNEIPYLRPDASQVTLEYSDDNKPTRIDAIVISTQHDDFDEESIMLAKIKKILYRFWFLE